MQLAIKSFLGLCLICSTAGAVEPAATPATPSPSAPSTQAAKPAPTSTTGVKTVATTAPTRNTTTYSRPARKEQATARRKNQSLSPRSSISLKTARTCQP